MPQIAYNGQLYDITQAQYDAYTIGSPLPNGAVLANAGAVASGGSVTETNTVDDTILTQNTTNNTPGQILTTTYQQATTSATDTNFGASTQTFDDGTTLQTFDDGSVLATGTDGSITSSPAPTEAGTTTQVFDDGSVLTTNADGSVSATNAVEGTNVAASADDVQAKAREGLTAAQLESLGGADATDPYIRARLDLPPLTATPNLVDALTPTPDPIPASEVATAPTDSNAGTTTQTFDDGTTLQTFDDGSALATGTDGSVTSSPSPTDAGTTTTVDDTTGAVTQTNDAGAVSVVDLSPTEVVYNAGEINSAVDPQVSLAPGETIIPADQISTDTPVNTDTDPTVGGGFVETSPGTFQAAEDAPVDPATDPTAGGGFVQQADGSFIAAEDAPITDINGEAFSPTEDPNTPQEVSATTTEVNNEATPVDPANDWQAEVARTQAEATTTFNADGSIGSVNDGGGTSADSNAADTNIRGLVTGAQQQQTIANQRKQINNGDWRVRLRLAPQAKYLYRAKDPGILQPLAITDGIIFPYTPAINTSYRANYSNYDLTHNNYRGYFYQNSYVDAVNLTATFTAQDTNDANYLLAVIHFLRSATKMFYGQDAQRGSPPPVVYLTGLGDYQFREHSCLISQFTYNLPADVDYIRAGSPNNAGLNFNNIRDRQSVATNSIFGSVNRLAAAFLPQGGITGASAPPTLGLNRPTYVPTKMEIQLTLLPIQSRQQVSKQFSLERFANGDLLKGGFW